MKVLVIDDDPFKVDRIRAVVQGARIDGIEIRNATTIAEAMSELGTTAFDLILLDLNLPIRSGENPRRDGGIRILRELRRNEGLLKPTYLIGLTGYDDLKSANQDQFEMEGWVLLRLEDNLWEEAVLNKINDISHANNSRKRYSQKILFLAANPPDNEWLRLDAESKKIGDSLLKSRDRDKIWFETKFAVDFEAASQFIMENEPNIVHFSGHGNDVGFAFEGSSLGNSALVAVEPLNLLFALHKQFVKCVVLASCKSENLAQDLSRQGIYVIGTDGSISDEAAIAFSVGFYQGIGNGREIEFSFRLGLAHALAADATARQKLWLNGNAL